MLRRTAAHVAFSKLLTVSSKDTRGGAREGSGRKRFGDSLTKRVNISIGDETADRYRQVGSGNLSAGIRRVAALLDDATIASLHTADQAKTGVVDLPEADRAKLTGGWWRPL